MRSAYRAVAVSAILAAASLVIRADVNPPSQSAEVQLQLGDILFSEGKFPDSLDAYRNALKVSAPDGVRRPRMGVIASALRVAEFDLARDEAEKLFRSDPTSPDATTLYGDALWSMGLFQEAVDLRPPDPRTWLTSAAVAADTTYLSGCGSSRPSCDDTPVCSVTGAIITPSATSLVTRLCVNGRAALGISALPGTSPKTVW